ETRRFRTVSAGTDSPELLTNSELLTNNVRAMIEDDSGYIWIGYLEGFISVFDPFEGSMRHLEPLNREAGTNGLITSFATDGAEHMWIGTSKGGLISYNRYIGRFTRYRVEANEADSLSSDNITALVKDDKEGLWIGTESNGLVLMNRTTRVMRRLQHRPNQISSLSNNSIRTIYRDKDDRIWIGTDGGLNLYVAGERFIHFTDINSNLANDLVLNIMQDKQGNYWIGTHYGLYTGFQSKFDIFDSKRGLPAESITSFAESSNGNLWIGSFDGLFVLKATTAEFLQAATMIPGYQTKDSRVMALSYHANDLWVGYRANGAEKIQNIEGPGTPSILSYEYGSGLSSNAVTHIMSDTHHNTWISTFGGGLNLLTKDFKSPIVFRSQKKSTNSLSSDFIFQVTETKDGKLLIATTSGLNIYSRSTNTLSAPSSDYGGSVDLETTTVQSIHESRSGDVWLGLHYQGLALWKSTDRGQLRTKFHRVKTTPRLPSSTVYAIEEDSGGHLWLSTTNGLVRLNPATRQIITFDYSDGLQDNEFNFGASFKDSQGRLYFGGNKGYNRFRPEEVIQESEPPPMVMTNIYIAGEPIGFDPAYQNLSTLHLNHEDYFVNFEFSALDYTDPQKNRYQYRLENFDSQWMDIGARHNVSFTSLPSGIYQLQIKGANSDGVWNHEGLNLTMMVYPPPWLNWWAFTCYGAIVLWLLWFFRRYYDNYLLRERATEAAASMHITAERAMDDLQDQLEMEQVLVRNVHAHTENTLGVIAGLLSRQAEAIGDEFILELFADNQVRFNCLQQVEKNLYYMADRLEVNFRGFVEDLIAARFNRQPLANVDIAVVNEANEIGIPAEIALPAAMITNELFCNSIKHAFDAVKGVHYIRIAMGENIQLSGWTLEVSDSGSGLPESIDPHNPTTLGMELVQHFTRILNAELTVTRRQGTHFSVAIPKPPRGG
ncbi:MAG: triple tyrosine motif-containing protein, partial [Gammaproteobacteria bacterium]|nr:triple tyrosine motif-containing protein [Gammaproteobacteria bacterium]